MLTFDETTHTYFWNGAKVPSVTQCINEFQQVTINGSQYHINRYTGAVVPSYLMEQGAEDGKNIHRGAELILHGGIDWNVLDPDYVAPLRQFEKWLSDFDIQPLYTEFRVYHPKFGYAGTLDIVALIEKALAFIDIKSGLCNTVSWQLSAYEAAYCAQEKYIGRTMRYALWLPKDGSPYKFEPITGQNDFEKFKACMILKGTAK